MTERATAPECLNCGAALAGPFCAQCGQRVIPAYPSVREFIGDAWDAFVGYDGRFMRTLQALLRRPGRLTQEVLSGRRAQYISPVRLYLAASVVYFLIGASVPNMRVADPETGRGREVKIGLWVSDNKADLTPEERAGLEEAIQGTHWFFKPLLESLRDGGRSLEARIWPVLPKVFFALVPVFAGILALFYWRRPYLQHLIFGLHLHTVIFLALAVAKIAQFPNNVPFAALVAIPAVLFIVVYALRDLRRVYGSSWPATLAKALGAGIVYTVVSSVVVIVVVAALAFFL